jgi:hypothetical protein
VPLRAAQLFVRCRSLEELGEALDRALRKKGRPAREETLLALHEQGWGALLLPEPDAALARHFSERFGTALSLHLDGSQLALSVQTWESGQPGEEERDPQPPHFRDVEAVAWELLRYLGVPASLRLLQLAQVEVLRDENTAALRAVMARAGPELIETWTVFVVPPPREEGAPPVEPDVVVESKAGEARALEVRTLPGGIPVEAWAQALAAIEEAQALRLLRALADGEGPRMPRPAFAYQSLQPLRVEKLLAKARRERPWLARLLDPERDAPLTRAGLTELCRTRIADVARAHERHLEVMAKGFGPRAPGPRPDAVVRAPVERAYAVYLSTLDADAAAAQLAEETRALVEAAPAPFAAAHLLPTLLAGEPGDRAARSLAPELYAALLFDDGTRIAPVLASDLATLDLDIGSALDIAVRRLDALTDAAPEGIRWFDLEHGRVVICDFPDAGGAGRLLSDHARGLILHILGADFALAAAPTRDALLACAAGDDEGAAWLADEARRRFEEGPFPIHGGLWMVGADLLRPVADADAPASGSQGDERQ